MGPTGKLLSLRNPDEEPMDFDTASDIFREQAAYLIEGGADFMLLETQQDILEVKAAIVGVRQAFAECGKVLPIQAQVTLDTNGRMLLGTDIQAVLSILEGMGINGDRPELLDRPRAHARAAGLPGRARAAARIGQAQRRHAHQQRRRRGPIRSARGTLPNRSRPSCPTWA